MRALLCCLCLTTGACAFDPGAALEPGAALDKPAQPDPGAGIGPGDELGDGPGDEPGDGPGDEPGDGPESTPYVASSEETHHGQPLSGSYLDSHELDGVFEVIGAEIDKSDEKLEQRWFFEEIPAGEYVLQLVASSTTPDDLVQLTADYETATEKGHTDLFVIQGTGMTMSYEGSVALSEPTTLAVRVRLPPGIKADDEPLTVLEVDYLALVDAP